MAPQARPRRIVASLLLAAALAVLPILIGLAQPLLQLGNQTYARAAPRHLVMPVTGTRRFFGEVGGVAFSAVANGRLGQVVTALRYDPSAADGQRLVITVRSTDGRTQTAPGQVYDWQLVPLARYALDENGSAVTLFGHLQNQALEKQTRAKGGRIINYHPALQDTLLGLRLLQADILILQPNAADLFAENGRTILGAGEGGHNLADNQHRFREIGDWQQSQKALGNQYQSYVVGDLEQRVSFDIANGAITFSGTPHWTAWRHKHRAPGDRNATLAVQTRYRARVTAHNALVGTLNASRTRSPSAIAKLAALKKEIETLEQQLEELDSIEQMPEYSRALSRRVTELDGINPVVYRSLRTVMHYRALFKHFQGFNQPGFASFVDSLRAVRVSPSVLTPSIENPRPAPRKR